MRRTQVQTRQNAGRRERLWHGDQPRRTRGSHRSVHVVPVQLAELRLLPHPFALLPASLPARLERHRAPLALLLLASLMKHARPPPTRRSRCPFRPSVVDTARRSVRLGRVLGACGESERCREWRKSFRAATAAAAAVWRPEWPF